MTEISFRFNVADRLGYTCRYLRKAARAGRPAAATASAQELAELDRALWRFEPTDFVAHVLLRRGAAPPALLSATPVWLVESAADAPVHDLLVNLGAEPPPGFERFQRLVEVVSAEPADRDAARERWRHYRARGYQIESHEVGEETP